MTVSKNTADGIGLLEEKPLHPLHIGISEEDRARLGEELAVLLADTYMLYIKTQNFHWNVTGPFFSSLHLTFEGQYQDLAIANDQLAERIRSLGFFAVASCSQFKRLSTVKESEGVPPASEMVLQLVQGHEAVIRTARVLVSSAAKAGDHGTADLVTKRLETHEKAVWMLRSLVSR
jgi:starvation-inducible DNA-binding protein